MTRWLPICLLVFAFLLIGCTGGNTPKADPPKKSDPVAQGGGKDGDIPKEPAKGSDQSSNEKEKTKKDLEAKKKPQAAIKADFTLTAEALAKEFMADAKVAAAKFKDKVIDLTGPVAWVTDRGEFQLHGPKKDKDDFGYWTVVVNVGPVDLAQVDKVARLSKGQKIKAIGTNSRISDRTIELYDCKVAELEPSKMTVIPAADFAKEYDDDPEKAEKKYFQQDVILSGKFFDVGQFWVKLSGTAKTNMSFSIPAPRFFPYREEKGRSAEIRGLVGLYDKTKNEIQLQDGILIPAK